MGDRIQDGDDASSDEPQIGRHPSGRKGSACLECRKQKIKCYMKTAKTPCSRCRKKGLQCMVNRSIQTLLENDEIWKKETEQKIARLEQTEQRVARLEQALAATANRVGSESTAAGLVPLTQQHQRDLEDLLPRSKSAEPGAVMPALVVVVDLETSPGAVPGHHLLSTTASGGPEGRRRDILKRSTIAMEDLELYRNAYQNRLDHFVYGILTRHYSASTSIASLREVSAYLSTAVCTVGALHLASQDFEPLYKDFVAYSTELSLTRRSTIDDIRALCIGAFWLGDLSWSLIGIAVRISAELQLHKSFPKALDGDHEHYLRARLYFLVYVCDHHYSIPHGRPPFTRECEAVRNARTFLECEHATEDDARLISQVLRWSVCSNIYDAFGSNVERPISDVETPRLRQFSIALDTLRAEWEDRFRANAYVGNYPRKGVSLQYHFAKLYLGSYALRGRQANYSLHGRSIKTLDMDELANSAVFSAISILRLIVSDKEIQSYLNGLPTYFHTMITFAMVFLLKVSTHRFCSIQLDGQEVQCLRSDLVTILKQVTHKMHPHHLLVSITKSLDEALLKAPLTQDPSSTSDTMSSTVVGADQTLSQYQLMPSFFDFPLNEEFGQTMISDYDMLLGQH